MGVSYVSGKASGSLGHVHENGVVLLGALVFVLIASLGASGLVAIQRTQAQRDREQQLLFAGDQYRRAIASYRGLVPPGGARTWPQRIEDLLSDPRFPRPVQHLRRAYPDPMTGKADWELIVEHKGMVGVRSRSAQTPMKQTGFPSRYRAFERREAYRDWEFRAQVP